MKPGARPGTYVILTVEDNGSGIPADIRDKIFDPFFTTKGPGHGSGLGLFNVVNIVRTHGGFLDFRTLLGKGTLFTIGLPCLSSAAIAEAGWDKNASTLSGGLPAELPMGAGEVVLVVDDEASIREIMRATLEAAGYQVLTASDGAEATALYAQKGGSIHAVIMDIMMPVMNGTAALNALHTLDPQVRAIVASGYQKKQTIDIPSFVKAILAKPFTASTLLKTVRQALSA
jgi:CheY-like chemotaxis protein